MFWRREVFFTSTRNLTQISFPPRSEPRQYTHWAIFASVKTYSLFNPLNAKLNPICHLLALLGTHPILHVSRIRVNYPLLYWGRNIRACKCVPFMCSLFKSLFWNCEVNVRTTLYHNLYPILKPETVCQTIPALQDYTIRPKIPRLLYKPFERGS